MAKLTDDQINMIISLDAKGAQGEINNLEIATNKLEKQYSNLSKTLSQTEKELSKQEKKLESLRKKGKEGTLEYQMLQRSIESNKKSSAEYTSQLKSLDAQISNNRKQIKTLTDGLKLSDMSMRQLRERAAELKKQLDLTSRSGNPKAYRELTKELNNTQKAMGVLSDKQKSFTMVMNTMWGGILSNVATKGFQLLTTAIRSGVQTIIDFEQENANLASVLGKSQQQVQALTDDAKRLGAQTQYTASQITQLQTELAKLGFSETEILNSTEAVQAFATATGATLPEAAGLAGAALRAFGLDSSEMERVVSTMGVATSKSALDFTYLQNSMSTVAPVAKKFGFSIEDTTALLGTLANSGFDASSAATATRNILLNLADSSGKLAKRLGEPIRSMNDLIPALKKLKDGGVDLAEALDLTDKRSVAAFATFLEGTDTLQDLRDGITDVSDELHKMEKERLQTVQGSLTLLSSAWNGLMLSFSNSKGPIKVAVDWLTKLINKVTGFVNGEAEKLNDQQIMLGDYYDEYVSMTEMTYEEAKTFHEQMIKDDEAFLTERERILDELSDRDDEDSQKKKELYNLQISQRKVYIEERRQLLDKMEAEDADRRKKAEEEAAKERKRQAEERRKQAQEEAKQRQEQQLKKYQQRLAELKRFMQEDINAHAELYAKRRITEEEYHRRVKQTEQDYAEQMLKLARDMGQDTVQLEQQAVNHRVSNRKQADAEILRLAKQARDEMLRVYAETEKAALNALESEWKAGHLGTANYEQKRKELTEQYAALRLQTEKTFAAAVEGLNESVVEGAAEAVQKAEQTLTDAQGRNISRLKDDMHDLAGIVEQTASLMGDTLGGQVMQGLEKSMSAVSDFMAQSSHNAADYVKMIGSVMQGMMQGVEQIMKTTFEAETAALEAEKAKQLSLVGDNSEAREKIEYEYAQKAIDLKKKQADSEAAMQTANLWINTAVGIAGAWSSSIAQLGPIAGSIAAAAISALLLTTAGIQQNNILKQRDAIKNTTLESSAGSSGISSASSTDVTAQLKKEFTTAGIADQLPEGFASGGYTGDGGVLQPAGIVHKGEYVVAQAEMHNPKVVPMVRAIEQVRQKRINGSAADPVQHSYATGGLAAGDSSELVAIVKQLSEQLLEIKRTPLRALVNYQEFEHADNLMTALRQRISN